MDEDTKVVALLAELKIGQQDILRRLAAVEESIARGRATDSDLKERITRLEERNAFLMKLAWGAGTLGGGSAAGHVIQLVLRGG